MLKPKQVASIKRKGEKRRREAVSTRALEEAAQIWVGHFEFLAANIDHLPLRTKPHPKYDAGFDLAVSRLGNDALDRLIEKRYIPRS